MYPLLSSVRDAVARLPNGEGTRGDICELLKDSQFLAPGITDAQVLPYTFGFYKPPPLCFSLSFDLSVCL